MFSLCVFIIYRNVDIYSLKYPPKISKILVPSSVKSSVGLLVKAERNSGLMPKGAKLFHSWGCSRITPITSSLASLQHSQHRKATSTVSERLETHIQFKVSVWDICLWHLFILWSWIKVCWELRKPGIFTYNGNLWQQMSRQK